MLLFWLPVAVLPSLLSLAVSQSIDPSSVPIATRDQWCQSQITQCPLICLQTKGNSASTEANDCNPETLQYDCVCSNGISPNASQYSQTMAYYICTEYNNQCVANCGTGNNQCASDCRQNHPCGAQSPTRVTTTSSIVTSTSATDSAASTASDGAVYTGFGGGATTGSGSSATSTSTSDDSSSHNSAARLVLNLGEIYGLSVVAGGIFAGFAFML